MDDALVSWKTKRQTTISRSSAESEYRVLAIASCEPVWLSHLMTDLQIPISTPALIFCDNEAAIHIASNPIFHEQTNWIVILLVIKFWTISSNFYPYALIYSLPISSPRRCQLLGSFRYYPR